MSVFSKYNKTENIFKYNRDTPREFITMAELYDNYGADHEYTLYGIWFNNGRYGIQGVAVLDTDKYVDLPIGMTDTLKDICADNEAVAAINAGECKVKIYRYFNKKYYKDCYNISFI